MFYCEREHSALTRKMKRRSVLTDAEKDMMNDARIDPSASERRGSYSGESLQKLMGLLQENFPGIEDKSTTDVEDGESSNADDTASVEGADSVKLMDSFVNVSMAMAKSLDACLGELTEKPTVSKVRKQMHHSIAEGIKPDISQVEVKKWCSSLADELSTHVNAVNSVGATGASIKSSVAKIQGVIAQSAIGLSGVSFAGSTLDKDDEETKMDEDGMAKLETKSSESQTDDIDSGKLIDWVNPEPRAGSPAPEIGACGGLCRHSFSVGNCPESQAHAETGQWFRA